MTRWSRHAVIVLLVASMVVAAVPAQVSAASGTLVVGSRHTDFGTGDEPAPDTLSNLMVSGSGDSATVQLESDSDIVDGFEDGDISEWSGDTGVFEASTDRAHTGSYSLKETAEGSSSISRPFAASQYSKAGLWLYKEGLSGNARPQMRWQDGGTTGPRLIIDDGDIAGDAGSVLFNDGAAWIDTGIDITANSWHQIEISNIDYTANTYDIVVRTDSGTVGTYSGASFASSISELDGVDLSATLNDQWYIDDITAGPTTNTSATYINNHSISDAQEAAINITQASNVSVDATIRTAGGTVLGSDTITTTGNKTIALANTSSSQLETVLNVTVTGDNPQFELADESILFHNLAPSVDNASASPSGGEAASNNEVTLSVNVSDPEIGSAQGEDLTVEWYINSTKVDTTTGITTNGTVSTTVNDVDGGNRQWHAVVTDSYGASTTSDTFTFRVPNNLAIRNVSSPNNQITGSSVELTFYASENVFIKNDSDGDGFIELGGIDGDNKFVAVTEAQGYYSRSVIIDSIYEQNSIYLLDKNKSAVEVRFTIDDPSGTFSSGEAEVFVEKALTRDFDNDSVDETRVVRVASDEVGVNGFTTYLEEGARYRIKVRNKDGDTRFLGAYTADRAETVQLQPVALGIVFDNESHYTSEAYRQNITGQTELVFAFGDAGGNTTDLNVRIWEQGNQSHQPDNWDNVSLPGPFGTYQASPVLTANETDTIWVVNYTAQRDGEEISGQHIVGPDIQQQLGGVAPWLLEAVAMVAIILTGALFSKANAGVGGVTTAMMGGGFWYAGWLSAEAGGGIVLFLAIAIAYKFKGDMV